MIKRQAVNKNTATPMTKLVCHKGQGVCHVPPIVRSQQWNMIRCAYKARCPACWLKMCLRSFKMPAKLRSNLAEMLPVNMQSIENLALDTTLSGSFSWKKMLSSSTTSSHSSNNGGGSSSTGASKAGEPTMTFESIKLPETDNNLIHLENHTKRGTAHLRTRKKEEVNVGTLGTNRQKLNIKGPRVKHVCRSASIVLGQTLATFQNNIDIGDEHHLDIHNDDINSGMNLNECSSCAVNGVECNECSSSHQQPIQMIQQRKHSSDTSESSVTSSATSSVTDIELDDVKNTQANYTFQLSPKLQQVCSEPVYDAFEVSHHGFGLVMTRGVIPKEVCFLCGSAGYEEMMHCAICCEPYHHFCAGSDAECSLVGRWICPKCVVVCSECHHTATKTTPCLLCQQLFHTTCLGTETAVSMKSVTPFEME